jgi:hypothetical protein
MKIYRTVRNIHYYDQLLKKPIILTGDFNSNTMWDKPRKGNNTAVVNQLAKRKIHSIYKKYQQERAKKPIQPFISKERRITIPKYFTKA